MSVCIFFGHRDCPGIDTERLRCAVEKLIQEGVDTFYVGNNGSFDTMIRRQLEALSQTYPITYSVVLAYLPTKKSEYDDFTNTLLPEGIETIPKRFAISYRNKWMIEQADVVVTYVTHSFGGAAQFKEMAERQGKTVIELSE